MIVRTDSVSYRINFLYLFEGIQTLSLLYLITMRLFLWTASTFLFYYFYLLLID